MNPQTTVLKIDMHFIVIRKDRPVETFSETHKIRFYTLAEMQQYPDNNGIKLLYDYNWDAKDETGSKMPRKETFRILAIAKKS